jgi:hypothetical protein
MTPALKTSITRPSFGLNPGACPVRDVGRLRRPNSWSGHFASPKAVGPAPFESLLERDFQTLLSVDPRILEYAAQPHQLEYWTPDHGGRQVKRRYTPDYVARDRNGQILIFEVKAKRFATASQWSEIEPYIAAAYEEDHGARFLIFTENEIRQQPRLSNCQILLSHRADLEDDEADLIVSDIMLASSEPRTMGEVQLQAGTLGLDARRTYSAIMRAILAGSIRTDLSQSFGPHSSLIPEHAQ